MMAICGAQGRINIKHTCITYIAKSKTGFSQIKMCTCMTCDGYGKVDTRPGMGARYYHIYDECCGDGKVDTRPGMGTSYYIKFTGTSFCVITSLSFSFFILDMGYPSLFHALGIFFTHALSMVFFPFFIAHVSFSIILLEREVTPHMELYFYGMNGQYNANF
jgi:hypothetical protein